MSLELLDILFLEVFHVLLDEVQHIGLLVVGLVPQAVVGKRTGTAIPLQTAFAYLEQEAQILIVEQPFTVQQFHLLQIGGEVAPRQRGDEPLVPVKAVEDLPSELPECILVERLHRHYSGVSRLQDFLPPMRAL